MCLTQRTRAAHVNDNRLLVAVNIDLTRIVRADRYDTEGVGSIREALHRQRVLHGCGIGRQNLVTHSCMVGLVEYILVELRPSASLRFVLQAEGLQVVVVAVEILHCQSQHSVRRSVYRIGVDLQRHRRRGRHEVGADVRLVSNACSRVALPYGSKDKADVLVVEHTYIALLELQGLGNRLSGRNTNHTPVRQRLSVNNKLRAIGIGVVLLKQAERTIRLHRRLVGQAEGVGSCRPGRQVVHDGLEYLYLRHLYLCGALHNDTSRLFVFRFHYSLIRVGGLAATGAEDRRTV